MRIELENSMLRPTVHDDRYDRPYIEEECAEEHQPSRYKVGDIVISDECECAIVHASYDTYSEEWLYETAPIGESEWAYIEYYEHELQMR